MPRTPLGEGSREARARTYLDWLQPAERDRREGG